MGAPARRLVAGINVFVVAGSHSDTFHPRGRQHRFFLGFPVLVKVESTAADLNPPGLVFLASFSVWQLLNRTNLKQSNRTGTVSKGMALERINTGCLLDEKNREKEVTWK